MRSPWRGQVPPGGAPRRPGGPVGILLAVLVLAVAGVLWLNGRGGHPSGRSTASAPAVPIAGGAAMPAWQVCFTPGGACTDLIVRTLDSAQRSVLVQAYSFTSPPIAAALAAAQRRGVRVRLLLDSSQLGERSSVAETLERAGVEVRIDDPSGIAHNKVMVLDEAVVITGSFNFTRNAQERNAENLMVLRDPALARLYAANWERRHAVSERYEAAPRPSAANDNEPDTPKRRVRHNLF